MSLDSFFSQGSDFPSFPSSANNGSSSLPYIDKYVSENVISFAFSSINSRYINENYFVGVTHKNTNNITVIKEFECETDIIPKEFDLFINSDSTKGYQANGKDEYIAKIYVYVSTNADKLSHLYQCSENGIKEDEILFFLEDNTGDFSNSTLYARFGSEKIKNKLLQADGKSLDNLSTLVPEFNNDMLKELIRNGKVEAKTTILSSLLKGSLWIGLIVYAIPKAVGMLISQLGEVISSNLKIPESIWDSKGADYFLKKENLVKDLQIDTSFLKGLDVLIARSSSYQQLIFVPVGQQIITRHIELVAHFINEYNSFVEHALNKVYDGVADATAGVNNITYLSEGVAFICGVWNGLVDFIADLFKFVGLILETPFDIAYNFEEFLEAMDTFRENLKNFSFVNFLITAFLLKLEIDKQIYKFFTSENPREEYNFDKIAYFTGYGIAFIASLFIPIADLARIASISKIKKFVPDDFIQAINLAGNKTIKGSKAFITFIMEIGELLSKKGRDLFDELKKIIEKIVDWFKKNVKVFENTSRIKALKHLDDFKALRPKFRDSKLVERLWKQKIKSERLFPNKLRSLYTKYLKDYPNLAKGAFNQAEFKTTIKKSGKLVEEIEEFTVSGDVQKLTSYFGDPPSLPPNTINVLDDYANFEKFVEGAIDFNNQSRKYDSEIKYIFNFLKTHIDKGDEFIVETSNIFKTCGSCQREFVMLENYLTSLGKKIKIKVRSDISIKGTFELKNKLKIKK